jgi:hypothetical protein
VWFEKSGTLRPAQDEVAAEDVERIEDELLTVWLGNNSKELLTLDGGALTKDTDEETRSGGVDEDLRKTPNGFTSEGRTAVKDQVMVGGGRADNSGLAATLVTSLVIVT